LFDAAERHGVAGVVLDAYRTRRIPLLLPSALLTQIELRETARAADHEAHLATLRTIDAALARDGLRAIALKGPLFAERYYATPSSRATSDTDLLVAPVDLERAGRVLEGLGYLAAEGPEEERFRREHHHLHYSHPNAAALELHFHGYTGFGEVLPSPPLLERWRASPRCPAGAIGVLSPDDELVFLCVHAAAHRFIRFAWLYDMRLLLETMSDDEVTRAAERARSWGYARVVSFAASLLDELLGVPPSKLAPLGSLGRVRGPVARRMIGEPKSPILRSATRLLYTGALCDSPRSALRYTMRASRGHARRMLGLPP
jgi:hypothetical protein